MANPTFTSRLREAAIICCAPYPYRSQFDLVGIDNRAAGYMITEHLLKLGCKRPVFISRERSASTVQGRIAGFTKRCADTGWSVTLQKFSKAIAAILYSFGS